MRRLALAAVATLGTTGADASITLLTRHPATTRHRTDLGDWRLDVQRDTFSGTIVCRLRARDGRALYRAGAVGFRFRRGWDVGHATYRVEGGPPRAWRDDLPELIRLAVPFDQGPMESPSAGIVWIPLEALAGANGVAIEPRPDRAPRVFRFRGLKDLLGIARARGCTPDERFGS